MGTINISGSRFTGVIDAPRPRLNLGDGTQLPLTNNPLNAFQKPNLRIDGIANGPYWIWSVAFVPPVAGDFLSVDGTGIECSLNGTEYSYTKIFAENSPSATYVFSGQFVKNLVPPEGSWELGPYAQVFLNGSFLSENDYTDDGRWTKTLTVPSGRHEITIKVDLGWMWINTIDAIGQCSCYVNEPIRVEYSSLITL